MEAKMSFIYWCRAVTGKDSIKELSYQEAMAVIKRLEDLQGGTAAPKPSSRKPKEHSQRPGGVTQRPAEENLGFDVRTEETR